MAEIVIRTDASLEIGTGHVMRCLALAEVLREQGQTVSFIIRAHPGHLGERIREAGFDLTLLPALQDRVARDVDAPIHAAWAGVDWREDARATASVLKARAPDWLIVDHYAFDARWERAVAGYAGRLLVWDDLADRPHECDLLLDQNLGRRSHSYAGLVREEARILAGPRYAVLRKEFATLRQDSVAARQHAVLRRIMVSMGGIDPPNATEAVLDVLGGMTAAGDLEVEVIMGNKSPWLTSVRAKAASMPMQVNVAIDVTDMAYRMCRADLAIGAVGGTTWERCALALPSLLLVIADNQRPAAEALGATGAAVFLGDLADGEWRTRLAGWLADPARDAQLPGMAAEAAAICDGRGALRVAAEMQRPPWQMRDAAETDAREVYDWRYGSGVDRFAQRPAVPDFSDHVTWFSRALSDDTRRIRILEVDGKPCGYVRLDIDGESATVSLCLAQAIRGQGWGGILLEEASRIGETIGLPRLDASVQVENVASWRIFETAGYQPVARDGAFQSFALGLGGRP